MANSWKSSSPMLSPPDRLASGSTSRHFVRNTVDMANQLLDAIEEDISSSREAIFARDHQRKSLEQENSDLQQRLLEAKGEINNLKRVVEDLQRSQSEKERRYEIELREYKESCQSEMDRVLHQVRVKEEQMHRTLDQSASYKTKCGTLQQKLDELVRERSGISEDFARLHEEKKVLSEKLFTWERYSQTLETACAELKQRLEQTQEQLSRNSRDSDSDPSYEQERERERQKYIAKHFSGDNSLSRKPDDHDHQYDASYEQDKERERQKYIAKHFAGVNALPNTRQYSRQEGGRDEATANITSSAHDPHHSWQFHMPRSSSGSSDYAPTKSNGSRVRPPPPPPSSHPQYSS